MKILDASALINAHPFRVGYTVQAAIDEIRDLETSRMIGNLVMARKLILLEPGEKSVKTVRETAEKTGDTLSKTDTLLLALALDKNAVIVTDDYGIQNVAKKLGVKFEPAEQKGIRHHYVWMRYCPACRKFRKGMKCGTCGTTTRRKVVSRSA